MTYILMLDCVSQKLCALIEWIMCPGVLMECKCRCFCRDAAIFRDAQYRFFDSYNDNDIKITAFI